MLRSYQRGRKSLVSLDRESADRQPPIDFRECRPSCFLAETFSCPVLSLAVSSRHRDTSARTSTGGGQCGRGAAPTISSILTSRSGAVKTRRAERAETRWEVGRARCIEIKISYLLSIASRLAEDQLPRRGQMTLRSASAAREIVIGGRKAQAPHRREASRASPFPFADSPSLRPSALSNPSLDPESHPT